MLPQLHFNDFQNIPLDCISDQFNTTFRGTHFAFFRFNRLVCVANFVLLLSSYKRLYCWFVCSLPLLHRATTYVKEETCSTCFSLSHVWYTYFRIVSFFMSLSHFYSVKQFLILITSIVIVKSEFLILICIVILITSRFLAIMLISTTYSFLHIYVVIYVLS